MKLKLISPISLILTGVLFMGTAGLNFFVNIPEKIQEYVFQRQINAPISLPKSTKVNDYLPKQQFSSDAESFTQKSVLRQELVALKHKIRVKTPPTQQIIREAYIPDRIVIDSIHLDAPVIIATSKSVELKDQWFEQWAAPDEFAVGWHDHSAPLGILGNTVLNGHHNEFGKVFANLVYLKEGDLIRIYSGNKSFWFKVTQMMVLNEREASLEVRKENAKWINKTDDVRLTLVTCWPKRNNTHRLIIVALPVGDNQTQELSRISP